LINDVGKYMIYSGGCLRQSLFSIQAYKNWFGRSVFVVRHMKRVLQHPPDGGNMIAFHSDLDNTLIFSYKHEIGEAKRCVEIYQGREVSFITEATYHLLKKLPKQILLIPTTTRTEEQYRRIDLGLGQPQYALVCNGGVLLVHGQEEEAWYRESMELVAECRGELQRAEEILLKDADRSFEVRNIRDLFLFTKSKEPELSAGKLRKALDMKKMNVFTNGVKVYAVPKKLNKGEAVRRFRERFHPERVIAAGDSAFDLPMLAEADMGLAPEALEGKYVLGKNVHCMEKGRVFSERVLEYVLRQEESLERTDNGSIAKTDILQRIQ